MAGLVAQAFNRPDRNLTGITCRSSELGQKRLQLLKETVPTVERVAVLLHATEQANAVEWEALQAAAPGLGVRLIQVPVRAPDELEPALTSPPARAEALAVLGSSFTLNQRPRIVALTAQQRLPAVYAFRDMVQEGGLMSYGTNLPAMFRRAGALAGRVLHGARPAELPVEGPTAYDLVVNVRTAQALGLSIPPSILQQATELIQ